MNPLKSRRKLYLIIGSAVIILAIVIAAVVSRKREKPIPVTTDKAVRKSITQLVTATGRIQPEVEVKIAPEVSGEIVEIPVVEGQAVTQGQLLLRIKPDTYRAQVESQQAALSGSRAASVRNSAEVAKAEADYQRARKLYQDGLLSDSELNAAKTTYDVAKAGQQASHYDIKQAEGALRQ